MSLELRSINGFAVQSLVIYRRVSTVEQGDSGLGLEAQLHALELFADAHGLSIAGSYVDVESGRSDHRAGLDAAIQHVKRLRGSCLAVTSLCRIARRVYKALGVLESVAVISIDRVGQSQLEVHLRLMIAEEEARLISARTKAALAAAKARGVVLGKPENLDHEARCRGAAAMKRNAQQYALHAKIRATELHKQGHSLRSIGQILTTENFHPRNGGNWHAAQIKRLLNN